MNVLPLLLVMAALRLKPNGFLPHLLLRMKDSGRPAAERLLFARTHLRLRCPNVMHQMNRRRQNRQKATDSGSQMSAHRLIGINCQPAMYSVQRCVYTHTSYLVRGIRGVPNSSRLIN